MSDPSNLTYVYIVVVISGLFHGNDPGIAP